MTQRRLPRWSELRPYLRTQPVHWSAVERRLAGAATISDLRRIARRHTPRAAFDYTDGAAETETSLDRARATRSRRVEFVPSVLRDVSRIDPSTTILGRPASLPLVFAPTGFTRFMNQRASRPWPGRRRFGSRTPCRRSGPRPRRHSARRSPTRSAGSSSTSGATARPVELIGRAEAAGYSALILTVDTPVGGSACATSATA